MSFEQQLIDLVFRFYHLLGRAGGYKNSMDIVEFGTAQTLADGRVGEHDDVILIFSHHVGTFFGQHAYHTEGNVTDANRLAQRVLSLEELDHHRMTDDADFGRCSHVTFGKKAAMTELPITHQQVIGIYSMHLWGIPVRIPIDDLTAGSD